MEKVDERLIGISPRWESETQGWDESTWKTERRTVYYEKTRIRYKCNSFGHVWGILVSRKV
jgi:hypothetical protein